ncbi:hypothetical protein PUN28_002261 [Cardiocondyla obscurior]
MNFKGRLILIDGAPEQIQALYRHSVSNSNNTDLQIVVLTNIMEIYSPGSSEKILIQLKKCQTWEEKYNIFAKQFLATNKSLSALNLKKLCITIYKYLSAVQQYNPSTLSSIKSSITLLRSTQLLQIPMMEEDYGLQKVTQNAVKVYCIEGTHITIMRNKKIASAINGEPLFAN